jgi:serine/threonine protein phosphatase PrpC
VKLPAAYRVGVATNTGRVRGSNEDDYLIGGLLAPAPELLFCAVADGMGGVAGGGEASRVALRALGAQVLDGGSSAPLPRRLQAGFAAASARVAELAAAVPALRDMGTTLSALCLDGERARIGHVGDSRIYRLRDGVCERLTTDHAVREPHNLLTRCIGGGHVDVEVDHGDLDLRAGDRFLLVSDGVWSLCPEPALVEALAAAEPQRAADDLVAAALRAGGHDNATAVVVHTDGGGGAGATVEVELPRDERSAPREAWPRPASLRAPVWPFLLLAAAVAGFVLAARQWSASGGGAFW